MTGIVAYILSRKFTKKTVTGLGALKGSPAVIKSIVPIKSTVDPNVTIANKITMSWDSNNSPSGTPVYHDETFQTLDNGRGIYDIEYRPDLSTAASLQYEVKFYDGTNDFFEIPASNGALKKKVVLALPMPASTADHNTIYLLQDDTKPGVYQQFLTVENEAGQWEWLSLGSTEVSFDGYQKKIDEDIARNYVNFDPKTKADKPSAPNVVGAINEFDAEIGGHYDFTSKKVVELKTLHKDNLISAINEIGDLSKLEMYDAATMKPDTLVDAINLASSDYSLDKNTTGVSYSTTDAKYTLYKIDDTSDPTTKLDRGNVIVPRIGISQRADTMSDTNPNYKTFDITVGGSKFNPDDPAKTPYGKFDIPHLLLQKIDPPVEQVVDTLVPGEWILDAAQNCLWQDISLHFNPISNDFQLVSVEPPSVRYTVEWINKDTHIARVKMTGTTIPSLSPIGKIKYTAENVSLASQYYLSYNGGGYNEPLCGCTIDIAKEMLLEDAKVEICTEEGVPVPTLHVGDKYIDLIFILADGSYKHAYIPCKDLFDPFIGKEAIQIEYSLEDARNYIRLIIYDPENLEALVQNNNGLRIMKGAIDQYGVVKLSGEDLAIAAGDTETAMTPADVLSFIMKSRAPGYQGFTELNDTTYLAINQLATTKIKEAGEDTRDPKDIATYVLEQTQIANLLGATEQIQKGDLVHDRKVVFQVEKFADAINPEEYEIYRLTDVDDTTDPAVVYQPGLYMYKDSTWHKVGGGGIIHVDTLPEDEKEIDVDCLYEKERMSVILDDGLCVLTPEAREAGWKCNAEGMIDVSGVIHSWDDVGKFWGSYWSNNIVKIADPDLNEKAYIIAYRYLDETSGETHVNYNYVPEQGSLHYYYKSKNEDITPSRWIEISNRFVDKYMDADLNYLYNIDEDELKPQSPDLAGCTFIVQEDGNWKIGPAGGILVVEKLPEDEADILTTSFYEIKKKTSIVNRYVFTQKAREEHWEATEEGIIDKDGNLIPYTTIAANIAQYVTDGILVAYSDDEEILEKQEEHEKSYIITYNIEGDDTLYAGYRYAPIQGTLYYYYKDLEVPENSKWIEVSDKFVGKYIDADTNHIVNIDANELKTQRPELAGNTFIIQKDGTWAIGPAGGVVIVDELFALEDAAVGLHYFLRAPWYGSVEKDKPDEKKWYHTGLYTVEEVEILGVPVRSYVLTSNINDNAYDDIQSKGHYLYDLSYSRLDYDYAKNYTQTVDGGCSIAFKDGKLYRNYDWNYGESASFTVYTSATAGGRHAVMGVAGAFPELTKDFVESNQYSPLYKIVPFRIVDGINDAGVAMAHLVVPFESSDVPTTGTNPGGEHFNASFAARYILDRAGSAEEAKDIFLATDWYVTDAVRAGGHELHYFVGDAVKQYCLYFKDNKAFAKEFDENDAEAIWQRPIMTNFKLEGAQLKDDKKTYGPTSGSAPTSKGYSLHASGLERYDEISAMYEADDMSTWVNDIGYTHGYIDKPRYTDLVEKNSVTVDTSVSEFATLWNATKDLFALAIRDDAFWQTVHTSVYDLTLKTMTVYDQEMCHSDGSPRCEHLYRFPVADGLWVQRVEKVEDAIDDLKSIVIETSTDKLYFKDSENNWRVHNSFIEIDEEDYLMLKLKDELIPGVNYIIIYDDDRY